MSRTKYANGVALLPTGALPPSFERVVDQLHTFGEDHPEIAKLEVFDSVADGNPGPGSDVDVLITFHSPREVTMSNLFDIQDAMASTLGCPVDLLERSGVEHSRNPFRRAVILESARVVYSASASPYAHA